MPGEMDFRVSLSRHRDVWSAGNYTAIAPRMVLLSELLCESAGVRSGERALDIGCGSGNAALAVSRRFGEVIGIDYVPALLERARLRSAVEELDARFLAADAEALP